MRNEALLSDERIELLLSWRHSGFSVHNTVTVEPADAAGTERLARYLLRPPLALERMAFDEMGAVLYRRKAQSRFGTAAVAFDPMDFLARLLMHIPQPSLHTVRYYGAYASIVRARRRAQQGGLETGRVRDPASEDSGMPSAAGRRRLRRAWAQLIRRIYEVDPLLCRCGAQMRILAFILDPHDVTRILRHIDHQSTAHERAPPVPPALGS